MDEAEKIYDRINREKDVDEKRFSKIERELLEIRHAVEEIDAALQSSSRRLSHIEETLSDDIIKRLTKLLSTAAGGSQIYLNELERMIDNAVKRQDRKEEAAMSYWKLAAVVIPSQLLIAIIMFFVQKILVNIVG